MICIVISYPIDIESLAGYELYGTKPCLLIFNPDGIWIIRNNSVAIDIESSIDIESWRDMICIVISFPIDI